MTQKRWKTMGYIIDFKNGSRCVFFLKRGRWVNFFRKGGGRPKKVGNLWSRQSAHNINMCWVKCDYRRGFDCKLEELNIYTSKSSSLLNYSVQLRTAFKRTWTQKVETSFFVGSVEQISRGCILETLKHYWSTIHISALLHCALHASIRKSWL
jgi:hypothetical protein